MQRQKRFEFAPEVSKERLVEVYSVYEKCQEEPIKWHEIRLFYIPSMGFSSSDDSSDDPDDVQEKSEEKSEEKYLYTPHNNTSEFDLQLSICNLRKTEGDGSNPYEEFGLIMTDILREKHQAKFEKESLSVQILKEIQACDATTLFSDHTFTLRISISGISLDWYRVVQVPWNTPLEFLHNKVICPIFGFKDDRSFIFRLSPSHYKDNNIPILPAQDIAFGHVGMDRTFHMSRGTLNLVDALKVSICDLLQVKNDFIWCKHDLNRGSGNFGLIISLERVEKGTESPYFRCIDGNGANPPERVVLEDSWENEFEGIHAVCYAFEKNRFDWFEDADNLQNIPNPWTFDQFDLKQADSRLQLALRTRINLKHLDCEVFPSYVFGMLNRNSPQDEIRNSIHTSCHACKKKQNIEAASKTLWKMSKRPILFVVMSKKRLE